MSEFEKLLASVTNSKIKALTEDSSRLAEFIMPSLERYKLPEIHIPSREEVNEYQSASVFMKALADAAL